MNKKAMWAPVLLESCHVKSENNLSTLGNRFFQHEFLKISKIYSIIYIFRYLSYMQRERVEIVFLPFLVALKICRHFEKEWPSYFFPSHFSSYVIYFSAVVVSHHNRLILFLKSFKVGKILKVAWIQSHHLQWKFKLWARKFAWGGKAKYCRVLSTKFWKQKVCWHHPAMLCLLTQVNFLANNLNFHWRWRWWDWI